MIESTLFDECDPATPTDCDASQLCHPVDSVNRCQAVVEGGSGIGCPPTAIDCPYPSRVVTDELACVCESSSPNLVGASCEALALVLAGRCEVAEIDVDSSCCRGEQCSWLVAEPPFEGYSVLIDCAYAAADAGACDDPSIMWDLCRPRAYVF